MILCRYFPANQWLALLVQGWSLPFVVGMAGHHIEHSILLWKQEDKRKAPAEARARDDENGSAVADPHAQGGQ